MTDLFATYIGKWFYALISIEFCLLLSIGLVVNSFN